MNPWSYPYGQALRFFNESNESMNPTFNIVAELSFNESSPFKLLNLNLNEWFYWALSCHSNSIFPSFKEPLNCFGWEKTSRACGRRLCSLKRKKREQSFAARWSVLIKIAFFRLPPILLSLLDILGPVRCNEGGGLWSYSGFGITTGTHCRFCYCPLESGFK